MYKRRDQNSFPAAAVPKKFSADEKDREKRRKESLQERRGFAIVRFILPLGDKWKTVVDEPLANRRGEKKDE